MVSGKTRGLFKQHQLRHSPTKRTEVRREWINGNEPSLLFECEQHCDWLGWIKTTDLNEMEIDHD
jgi:hypothetical protein